MSVNDKRVRFTRDGVLFITGLMGIAHETLVNDLDRYGLLMLFAGMVGLPFVYNKDEKNQKQKESNETRDSGGS